MYVLSSHHILLAADIWGIAPLTSITGDDAVAAECPVSSSVIFGLEIYWLGLIPPIFVGAFTGLVIGHHLLSKHFRSGSDTLLFGLAFVAFGCMNVDAFFYHVMISPENHEKQTVGHRILHALDCYFTGASSIALCGASLEILVGRCNMKLLTRGICCLWLLLFVLAFSAEFANLKFVNECIYLVPTILSFIMIAISTVFLPCCRGRNKSSVWFMTAILLVDLVAVGCINDKWLCDNIGPIFGFSPILLFAICDLTFLGLLVYINATILTPDRKLLRHVDSDLPFISQPLLLGGGRERESLEGPQAA